MSYVPRTYIPTYVAIKLTLVLLIGAALSLVFAALPQRAGGAGGQCGAPNKYRLAKGDGLYRARGIPAVDLRRHRARAGFLRHAAFLFTMPPIAVLAGLGLNAALTRLETRSRFVAAGALALVVLGFGFDATTLYRLHPDEYLFFNPLVGGTGRRLATL